MPRRPRTATLDRMRPRKQTIACPTCDVTWRGNLSDACWACGQRHGVEAPVLQVKIVS